MSILRHTMMGEPEVPLGHQDGSIVEIRGNLHMCMFDV